MKIPKPELNTEFWTSPEKDEKILKINLMFAIITSANIFTGMIINNYYLIIFNGMALTFCIMLELSHKKHKKEAQKQWKNKK